MQHPEDAAAFQEAGQDAGGVEGGKKFSDHKPADGDGDGSLSLVLDQKPVQQPDSGYAGGLFHQLGGRRNGGLLEPVAVPADAAMYGGTGNRIRKNSKQRDAAFIAQDRGGDECCVFLHGHHADTGQKKGKGKPGQKELPRLPFLSQGDLAGYGPGDGCLDPGSGEGVAERIDRKNELVQPYAFLPEGAA